MLKRGVFLFTVLLGFAAGMCFPHVVLAQDPIQNATPKKEQLPVVAPESKPSAQMTAKPKGDATSEFFSESKSLSLDRKPDPQAGESGKSPIPPSVPVKEFVADTRLTPGASGPDSAAARALMIEKMTQPQKTEDSPENVQVFYAKQKPDYFLSYSSQGKVSEIAVDYYGEDGLNRAENAAQGDVLFRQDTHATDSVKSLDLHNRITSLFLDTHLGADKPVSDYQYYFSKDGQTVKSVGVFYYGCSEASSSCDTRASEAGDPGQTPREIILEPAPVDPLLNPAVYLPQRMERILRGEHPGS